MKSLSCYIRPRDLSVICVVYALYLFLLSSDGFLTLTDRLSLTGGLHFLLMSGYLLLVDWHSLLFLHPYCRIRCLSRQELSLQRTLLLFEESALFWSPYLILLIYALLSAGFPFLTVAAVVLCRFCFFFALSLLACGIDLRKEKKHIGLIIVYSLLSLDFLQALGMLLPFDASLLYEPVFTFFPDAENSFLFPRPESALFTLLFLLLLSSLLLFLPPGKRKKQIVIPLRSLLAKALPGLPIGLMSGLFWARSGTDSLEVFWLFAYGRLRSEGGGIFLLLLTYSFPFLVVLLLAVSSLSRADGRTAPVLLVRTGSSSAWWRQQLIYSFLLFLVFSLFHLTGTTAMGLLIGQMPLRSPSAGAAVLVSLFFTDFSVSAALLAAAVLLALLADQRTAYLLIGTLFMGGYAAAYLPHDSFGASVLTIFLPARASLLLHDPSGKLSGFSDLFENYLPGLHPLGTAFFSFLCLLFFDLIGQRLIKKADFL